MNRVPQADDTIVVYTSDHDEMMGSQGLMGKRVPFEESSRVPFVVRYPGVTKDRHRSDVLFAAVDIYPTPCGLAGVPISAHCAGRDLSDAMRGRPVREPEQVFLPSQPEKGHKGAGRKNVAANAPPPGASGSGGESTCLPYRGVRTKTDTYVVADTGRWPLYDSIAGPFQMKSLVSDRSQEALMRSLDTTIRAWLRSVGDDLPLAQASKAVFQWT